MKKKKKTLLDLNHVPTLNELRTYFREENDFSAASYIDIDYDKLDSESVEMLEHIKGLMDEKNSITEDDRALLRMRMSGKTQQKIADALGYKTHSAVTKRLQKLKEIFENSDI